MPNIALDAFVEDGIDHRPRRARQIRGTPSGWAVPLAAAAFRARARLDNFEAACAVAVVAVSIGTGGLGAVERFATVAGSA